MARKPNRLRTGRSARSAYTPEEAIAAFWAKVDRVNGPTMPNMSTPCWVWIAGTRNGYGRFAVNGTLVDAHRHSWALTNGPVPDGLWALHKCDHPPCVNPEHLFLGTVLDNTRDMIAKGRARNDCKAQGERHGLAKLTVEIVREARRRFDAGESGRALAREYGVSATTMCSAIGRETWKHV